MGHTWAQAAAGRGPAFIISVSIVAPTEVMKDAEERRYCKKSTREMGSQAIGVVHVVSCGTLFCLEGWQSLLPILCLTRILANVRLVAQKCCKFLLCSAIGLLTPSASRMSSRSFGFC